MMMLVACSYSCLLAAAGLGKHIPSPFSLAGLFCLWFPGPLFFFDSPSLPSLPHAWEKANAFFCRANVASPIDWCLTYLVHRRLTLGRRRAVIVSWVSSLRGSLIEIEGK